MQHTARLRFKERFEQSTARLVTTILNEAHAETQPVLEHLRWHLHTTARIASCAAADGDWWPIEECGDEANGA